jgi:hypothetical protein
VGYLSYGRVAANVLFRVVNGRYLAHSAATSPSLHRAPGGGYVPGDATYHGSGDRDPSPAEMTGRRVPMAYARHIALAVAAVMLTALPALAQPPVG